MMEKLQKESLLEKAALEYLSKDEYEILLAFYDDEVHMKEEIKMRKDIIKGIGYAADLEFKEKLNLIHSDVIDERPTSTLNKPTHRIIYLSLAAVAAIVLILFVFPMLHRGLDTNDMFAEYYTPYNSSTTNRSGTLSLLYDQFDAYYRQGDYENAWELLSAEWRNIEDGEFKLMAGIAALEQNETQESEMVFKDIIQSNDSYYLDHARWYLALSYIQTNKTSLAIETLEYLIEDASADHHEQAKGLIKKLQ